MYAFKVFSFEYSNYIFSILHGSVRSITRKKGQSYGENKTIRNVGMMNKSFGFFKFGSKFLLQIKPVSIDNSEMSSVFDAFGFSMAVLMKGFQNSFDFFRFDQHSAGWNEQPILMVRAHVIMTKTIEYCFNSMGQTTKCRHWTLIELNLWNEIEATMNQTNNRQLP